MKVFFFVLVLIFFSNVYSQKDIIQGISKPKKVEIGVISDKQLPVIKIISPKNYRGMRPMKETSLQIVGFASDESGIASVSINNKEVILSKPTSLEMQQSGLQGKVVKFSNEVLLTFGENSISIKAIDTKGNSSDTSFIVTRESETISTTAITNDTSFIKGKYYALVIAVQDYKNINGLEFPIHDAENVVNVLTSQYTFENNAVQFLKNPDRKTIFNTLQQLKKKLYDEDNLLIYYAGHGFWDSEVSQGYWLPTNASWDDRAEWISNSDIRDYIKGIKTKHTLLISDACFSGGIFKMREAKETPDVSIQKMYELPSRKAITSGTAKTVVPDKSVFAEYLLKRLRENNEKYLDAERLYLNFKQAVVNNGPTIPQYGIIYDAGDEGEDFIFVRK
jgi:hypothetical protein